MRRMGERHPGAVCVYFLCVAAPVFFGLNPVTAAIGLLAGLCWLFLLRERFSWKTLAGYLGIVGLSGIVNPVFNHNGQTPLFFLNGNPVTLEALLLGLVMGLMISATLVWGRCFSLIMDTDRVMTVTGRLSPRASLVLSMAMRYLPLLRRQAEKTREARRGMGLTREENGLDRLRESLEVFDGLVTWGLENGVTTADSMTARGYGTGRRTRYQLYPWERGDTAVCAASLAVLGALIAARAGGYIGYTWYPAMKTPPLSWPGIAACLLFAALCAAGAMLEAVDRRKWRKIEQRLPAEKEE